MAVTHGMSLPACGYQLSDCRDPRKVIYFLFEEGKNPKSHQFKQSPPQGVGGRARGEGMATSPGLGGPWEHGAVSVG